MKFVNALEVTHELADHVRLDDKLADLISSDLNQQAAEQRHCVDMFEAFIASHHDRLSDRYDDIIDRLEGMDLADIPEISLESIRAVDSGPVGYMMSVTLELACQAFGDGETIGNPALAARMSAAINMVGQFWVEAGAEIAAELSKAPTPDDDAGPGM